nr:unnamed protein product [Callosobruchus analis]
MEKTIDTREILVNNVITKNVAEHVDISIDLEQLRRQVYIAPLDTNTLPESIEINHDGLSYRIFMTLDSQKCYKCNLTGHIASQCRSTHNAPTTSHSHIQESQQSTPEIQPHQNIQTSSSEHTILSQSATNDIALAKEDIDTTRNQEYLHPGIFHP